MGDLISRQDAIIAVRSHRIDINDPKKIVRKSYEDVIRELPSAEPERKKGKWTDSRDVCWLCSECGKWLDVLQGDVDMNFCPNCGSYNGGEQDG